MNSEENQQKMAMALIKSCLRYLFLKDTFYQADYFSVTTEFNQWSVAPNIPRIKGKCISNLVFLQPATYSM